jgi:hypothetical protein
MMESTEENIMINRGMNSEGIHHKKDHSLPGIKISFMVIVLIVLNLDIRLKIAKHMEEVILMWPQITLNVTNSTIMVT